MATPPRAFCWCWQPKAADLDDLSARYPRLAEIPFDSAHKFMATFHHDGPVVRMWVKGAPNVLLARATQQASPTGEHAISESDRTGLAAENEALAAQAMRVLAVAGVHHVALGDGQIVAGDGEAFLRAGRTGSFDLNADFRAIATREHQFNFCTVLGTIKMSGITGPCGLKDGLDHHALVAVARNRVAQHMIEPLQLQQGVDQATVPNIGFWGFDQPFAQVVVPGRHAAHQLQTDQQVNLAGNRRGRHPQCLRQTRFRQQFALVVRQHRPQPTHRGARQARCEHG